RSSDIAVGIGARAVEVSDPAVDFEAKSHTLAREVIAGELAGQRIDDLYVRAVEKDIKVRIRELLMAGQQLRGAQFERGSPAVVAQPLRFRVSAHAVHAAGRVLFIADQRTARELPVDLAHQAKVPRQNLLAL